MSKGNLMVNFILGIVVKILQDTKPGNDHPQQVSEFNTTILTWVCGGVCLAGLASIISLLPRAIGRRRKYEKLQSSEKTSLIPNIQSEDGIYGSL